MLEKFLTSLNWVDLVMALIICAMVVRGAVQGLILESFKFLGVLFGTFMALHYYSRSADFLTNLIAMPFKAGEIVSFFVIAIALILLFRLVGQGWILILKLEAKSVVNKWGGAIIAAFSAIMICGLLFFGLSLFQNIKTDAYTKSSLTGQFLIDLSPNVYQSVFEGLIRPFFPDEPLNSRAMEVVAQVPVL